MRQESAEVLALRVLAWLAANDELLPVFLGSTGAGLPDLRNRAQEPEFLGSVLDFVLMDDAWVLAAADALGVPPADLLSARHALPGGGAVHWT